MDGSPPPRYTDFMGIEACFARAGVVVALLATAACSSPPYVYYFDEFDRRRAGYGQDRTTLSEIVVCYNAKATRPDEIVRLAEEECAKVDMKARFTRSGYDACPLLTPAGAHYACYDPTGKRKTTQQGALPR